MSETINSYRAPALQTKYFAVNRVKMPDEADEIMRQTMARLDKQIRLSQKWD